MAEITDESIVRLYLNSELKFDAASEVCVQLTDGSAERFGCPLRLHKEYIFPTGFHAGIFSFEGASLVIKGKLKSCFTTRNAFMRDVKNLHHYFEQIRKRQSRNYPTENTAILDGPRILIVGPTDAGKSTLSRILCNYAARNGRQPLFIDLDIGQGSISVPGTIGATPWMLNDDIVDGIDANSALILNLGDVNMAGRLAHYNRLVYHLAEVITRKITSHDAFQTDGIVINTCGWIDGDGYESIRKAAAAFEVNAVVVLGSDDVFHSLERDSPSHVRLFNYPKMAGAHVRSRRVRMDLRQMAIARAFNGTLFRPASSYPMELSVTNRENQSVHDGCPSRIMIFRIQMKSEPETMARDELEVVEVSVDDDSLVGRLLAVMPHEVPSLSSDSLPFQPCAGFMVITAVESERQRISVLSTLPAPLPSRVVTQLSEVKWNCGMMDNDDDASGSQPPENSEFGGSPSEERLHFYPFLRDHIIRGGKPSRTNATNGGGGETEAKMNRVQLTKLPLERLRGIHARLVERVRRTNGALVKRLIEKDALHMQRDAFLVDIEDLRAANGGAIPMPTVLPTVSVLLQALKRRKSSGDGGAAQSHQSSQFGQDWYYYRMAEPSKMRTSMTFCNQAAMPSNI